MPTSHPEAQPVLISALEHWAYCPRQSGLIHLEAVWDENVFTLKGKAAHERVDTPMARQERGRRVERALPIWSHGHGLTGKADVVEFLPDGTPYPVETKVGKPPRKATPPEFVQLCAQALCLEEMFGREVPEGALYYVGERRRVGVEFDAELRALTLATVGEVRAMLDTLNLPAARYDAKCRRCSLLDACLPQGLVSGAALRPETLFRPRPEREATW